MSICAAHINVTRAGALAAEQGSKGHGSSRRAWSRTRRCRCNGVAPNPSLPLAKPHERRGDRLDGRPIAVSGFFALHAVALWFLKGPRVSVWGNPLATSIQRFNLAQILSRTLSLPTPTSTPHAPIP